jgi:hypothetical protein
MQISSLVTSSLNSLAEFLRIDNDRLYAAAEFSAPNADNRLDRDEVRMWVGHLAKKEKDDLITSLVADTDFIQVNALIQRFHKERAAEGSIAATTGRTVAQLFRAAEQYTFEKRRLESEKRSKHKARRDQEETISSERHLDSLVGRELALWDELDGPIPDKSSYKAAPGL